MNIFLKKRNIKKKKFKMYINNQRLIQSRFDASNKKPLCTAYLAGTSDDSCGEIRDEDNVQFNVLGEGKMTDILKIILELHSV